MTDTDLAADLPDVNDLVDVMLDVHTEPMAAVITTITGDTVALGKPIDRTGRIVLPDSGECGLLIWGAGARLRQIPIAVEETFRSPEPSWLVRLRGVAERCQRRSFVRAEVTLPIVVRRTGAHFDAVAVDLSEGGLRCTSRSEPEAHMGDAVTVEFTAGRQLSLRATVTRIRHGDKERPAELGLSFADQSISDADAIRRYVFAQLLEQRRRGAT